MIATLDCGGKTLDFSRTLVMGVLNVTPDSFSDGGHYGRVENAARRAERMVQEGAAIIDVGGESTRPGAAPVSEDEELHRVMPVIEMLVQAGLGVPVSVDTSKPAVMRAAVGAGAGLINDVWALRAPSALETARDCGVPVCLMHMQGEPRSMQDAPAYTDVVEEVSGFLAGRVEACLSVGIARDRLLLDPGLGFGKALEHNLQLIKHLNRLAELGLPLLVGLSRKRMIGELLDAPVDQRLHGSVAGAVLAAWQGAAIVRVHDVGPTVEALKVCDALRAIP